MQFIDYKDLTEEAAQAGCAVLNMPNDNYHAYPAISKSGLDLINRSPAHYAYQEPRESTRAMVIGTAIHAAILEPERFAQDYLLLKDVKDRRATEYKQAVKTRPAEYVLTGKEVDHVSGMQEVVRASSAGHYLQSGHAEVTLIGTCSVTGERIKARIDWLTADLVAIDLKKTQDIRYEKVQRSIAAYRYHVQAAWYDYVFKCVTNQALAGFKFLFMEEQMPHACKLYTLDDEALQIGRIEALKDLDSYKNCRESGHYPMPDDTEELISLPTWALPDEEEVTL